MINFLKKIFKKKEPEENIYKENLINICESQIVKYLMLRLTESLNTNQNYCIIYFDDFTHFKNYCNNNLSIDARISIFDAIDRQIKKSEQTKIIKNIFIKNIKKINNIILLKKIKIYFHKRDHLFDTDYVEISWKY